MSHPVSRTTGPITVSFSGFELCSLPWILLPTSLASGPHSIELNVRGCFVIQLSTCSAQSLGRFHLKPQKLLYFITVSFVCQELFYFLNQDSLIKVLNLHKNCSKLCIQATLIFYHIPDKCQEKFAIIKLIIANERRRRDLNPCAAINDLLTFQASPFGLLGTSPNQ